MSKYLSHILAQGVIDGLLKPIDDSPTTAARPWPLILFSAIGAWFSAIPFALLIYEIAGGEQSLAISGAAVFLFTTVVLCTRPPLFLEQLALAGMLAGALVAFFYIEKNSSTLTACVNLFVACAIAACAVPQAWLRSLLGAGLGIVGIVGQHEVFEHLSLVDQPKFWSAISVGAACCLISSMPSNQWMPLRFRAFFEALTPGMSAAVICSPFWINDSFFFTDVSGWLDRWSHDLPPSFLVSACTAVTITLSSAIYAARRWPVLRELWFLEVATVLGIFTWFVPASCVLALLGVQAMISGRRITALLCASMLVWWMGKLYFSLQLPLIDKAILLAGTGVLLALTTAFMAPARLGKSQRPAVAKRSISDALQMPQRAHAVAILGCALVTLSIANISIMRIESLANISTTVFVELKPVDPRSLMQGDYMRLSFGAIPFPDTQAYGKPVALVGTVDIHGVWVAKRIDDGTMLLPSEVKINLSGTSAHPIFVTDAWFFKEGEAKRWEMAKFGEFLVAPDGSASLVTLRGENLKKL